MKELIIDLGDKHQSIQIIPLADLHIGDAQCDLALINRTINYIKNTPNAFTIVNGDIINNATKVSKSNIYEDVLSIDEQIDLAIELLKPIKDKILLLTSGNHEYRTNILAGVDPIKMIGLGIGLPKERYSLHASVVTLLFGRYNGEKTKRNQFVVYALHGRRGGGSIGSSAKAIESLGGIVPNADLYLQSHVHQIMGFPKTIFIYDKHTRKLEEHFRDFVVTNAFLKYGGYAEMFGLEPKDRTPISITIAFTRNKHKMIKHCNVIKLRDLLED